MSGASIPSAGEGSRFTIGPGVARAAGMAPYEPRPSEPRQRRLQVYALDPTVSRFSGCVATLAVPYEPLAPGPIGALLEVDPRDGADGRRYGPLDLDHPHELLRGGRAASPADPQFHQQMVYAVASAVYTHFRRALGRDPAWGFPQERLRLVPHAFEEANAWYDRSEGALLFGYYRPDAVIGRNLQGGYTFTGLSHDIVAHEMAHALLDGMRAHLLVPSNPQVLAFHEGFADLVALFMHFSYPELVRGALREAGGNPSAARLLFGIGRQLGETTGRAGALRQAFDGLTDDSRPPALLDLTSEHHTMGAVLVAAVFDAFATVYRRRIDRLLRIAGGGLPPAAFGPELQEAMVDEAVKLAERFLTLCIRAVDYCPPVDLELGEYLRAIITADTDVAPEDPWGYREALVDAFRRRGIYPTDVPVLAEEALLWERPDPPLPPIPGLGFDLLRFRGDPGRPAGAEELLRQARVLGARVADPAYARALGLLPADDPRVVSGEYSLPQVESVRTARRTGPSGRVVFDLVAEVTQTRRVRQENLTFEAYGGATVILGPEGEVRYLIAKRVDSERRLARQLDYLKGEGRRFWRKAAGELHPDPQLFRMLEASPLGLCGPVIGQ